MFGHLALPLLIEALVTSSGRKIKALAEVGMYFQMTDNLEDFLKIRSYTNYYCNKINNNENVSLNDFSRGIANIWPPAKLYPLSASLIAESLMPKDLYQKLMTK